MTPTQRRAAADFLCQRFSISQRRASHLLDCARSTLRYRRHGRADEQPLIRALRRLARRHLRWGYRRIHARLRKQGWSVNLKRVRRLWNQLGLRRPLRLRKSRKLGPKPGSSANSCVNQLSLGASKPATYGRLKTGRGIVV